MDNFVKKRVGKSHSFKPLMAKRIIDQSTLKHLKLYEPFWISVYLQEYQEYFSIKCVDVEVKEESPETSLAFLSYNPDECTLYRSKKYEKIFALEELEESARYLVRTVLKSGKLLLGSKSEEFYRGAERRTKNVSIFIFIF